MPADDNVTADALSQALASMFNLAQAGIDWAAVYRAVLAHREEQRELWHDEHDELSGRYWTAEPPAVFRTAHAGNDAVALSILVQAALLRTTERVGKDWQNLLRGVAPELKRAIDLYQADSDPSKDARDHLIDTVRESMLKVGAFFRDKGAEIDQDLGDIVNEVLARTDRRPLSRAIRTLRHPAGDG